MAPCLTPPPKQDRTPADNGAANSSLEAITLSDVRSLLTWYGYEKDGD